MSTSRLTPLDASFLEVETPSAPMHVGWAAVLAPPTDGPLPSFSRVRDHIAGRMSRAPRYRQRLARVPWDVNNPVWTDDPTFDIDRHLHQSSATDLDVLADEVMSQPLRRDRPLWEIWIADRLADGRMGIVGKAHHAMVDGIAALELASLLLDPTPESAPSDDGTWAPSAPPGAAALLRAGVAGRVEDLVDLAGLPLRLMRHPRRWRRLPLDTLCTAWALWDFARPSPRENGLNEPISARRHLARTQRPLEDLKRIKRGCVDTANGVALTENGRTATINDVVLAVVAGGLRHFVERRGGMPVPLKAMVPVNIRSDAGGPASGNRISFVFVDLPCHEPSPLRRLTAVRIQMLDRKHGAVPEGSDRALQAARYAPRSFQRVLAHLAASPRTFNLVVSNVPGPPRPVYMLGCELREVYPVVPLADRHGLAIGMTTVQDQAFFGVYADRQTVPDADLLARCLDESVDELLHAAT